MSKSNAFPSDLVPSTDKPACSVDGCEKPVLARGMCGAHYQRWYSYDRRGHEPRGKSGRATLSGRLVICREWQCPFPEYAKGLCRKHHEQRRRWRMAVR
jgi:hypothetical protein